MCKEVEELKKKKDDKTELEKNKKNESTLDSLKMYIIDVSKEELLTQEEEIELFKKVSQGDQKARERLILCNLRLVLSISKRYPNYNNVSDIIQAGNLGLIKAVDKFDYRKGNKFSTYATKIINDYICKFLANNLNTIRVPYNMFFKIIKYNKTIDQFNMEYGRLPTDKEIIEKMNISEEMYDRIKFYKDALNIEYLDAPLKLDDKENKPFGEFIENTEVNMGENIFNEMLRKNIFDFLNIILSEKEREVIVLSFGLKDGKCKNSQEIANIYNITREAVRQIKNKALKKLRESPKRKLIEDYYYD